MEKLFESVEDRINALAIKYPTISKNDLLDIAEFADPSKNKTYLQWLLNLRAKNKLPNEDFNKTFRLLENFDNPKIRQFIRNKDINSYKSVGELFEVVNEIASYNMDFRDKTKVKEDTLVAENSNWTVHIPKTRKESKVLGSGTNWCTAADSEDGESAFENYDYAGPLIIFINKHNPKEKYQLHNGDESSFLNKNDDEFDIIKTFGNDRNLFKNTPIIFENLCLIVKMILSLTNSNDLTVETDLKIDMGEYNTDFIIPDNLTVKGSLRIENYRHKKLPENLTVFGTLSLFNSDIDELPKSLKLIRNNSKYENNFNIKPSRKVRKFTFPDNYTIGKNVSFTLPGMRDWIEFHGNNLTINGNLLIPNELTENINIDNLTNLKVTGNIYRAPVIQRK